MQASSQPNRPQLPERPIFTSSLPSAKPTASPVTPRAAGPSPFSHPPHLHLNHPIIINASTPLAISRAHWPENAHVNWKVFVINGLGGVTESHVEDVMEGARRKVAREWERSLWVGLTGTTRMNQISRTKELWIFEVADPLREGQLEKTQYHDLIEASSGHFHPAWLYPCPSCASGTLPCDKCTVFPTTVSPISMQSPCTSLLLPRLGYRTPLAMFLVAIRDKLLDLTSLDSHTCRLRDGLVLTTPTASFSKWQRGWAEDESQKFILRAHLHLKLSADHLLIQPLVRPSPFLLFPPLTHSRPAPGTPVTLLPHGHLAYYLESCDSPPSWDSFIPFVEGRGVMGWRQGERDAGWIKCWVRMPAKDGVDHGVEILWPLHLVVLDVSRTSLSPIPGAQARISVGAPLAGASVVSIPGLPWTGLPVGPQMSTLRRTLRSPRRRHDVLKQNIIAGVDLMVLFTEEAVKERERARADKAADKDKEKREREEKERKERELRVQTIVANKTVSKAATTIRAGSDPPQIDSQPLVSAHSEASVNQAASPNDLGDQHSLAPLSTAASKLDLLASISSASSDSIPLAGTSRPNRTRGQRIHLDVHTVSHERSAPSIGRAFHDSPESSQSPDVPLQQAVVQRHTSLVPRSSLNEDATMQAQLLSSDGDGDLFSEGDELDNMDTAEWSHLLVDNSHEPPAFNENEARKPIALTLGVPRVHRSDGSEDGINAYGLVTDDDFAFFDEPQLTPDMILETPNEEITLSRLPSLPLDQSMLDEDYAIPGNINFGMEHMISMLENTSPGVGAKSISADIDDATAEVIDLTTPMKYTATRATELGTVFSTNSQRLVPSSFLDDFCPLEVDLLQDSKYTVGKFAFPQGYFSSDTGLEELEHLFYGWDSMKEDWYRVATDAKVGLVNRLKGIKRKRAPKFRDLTNKDFPVKRLRSGWVDEPDMKALKTIWDGDLSDDSSEDNARESVDGTVVVEDDETVCTPALERSPSPIPSYPPLSPISILLLYNSSLMSEASQPTYLPPPQTPPAPVSVPTPVSPATAVNTTDSDSRLEISANALCEQALNDPLLATALTEHRLLSYWRSARTLTRVARVIQGQLKAAIPFQSMLQLKDIADHPDMSTARSQSGNDAAGRHTRTEGNAVTAFGVTNVAVGLGGAVITVSTAALRFWEKLGLEPVGGRKDVMAFVLYEPAGDETDRRVTRWLKTLSRTYNAKGFGQHNAAHLEAAVRNGLVPVQWDFLFSKLGSIMRDLPVTLPHVVFYLLIRPSQAKIASSFMNLLGPIIARRAEIPGRPGFLDKRRILFHFVVDRTLLESSQSLHASPLVADVLATSIYQRIVRVIERDSTRTLYGLNPALKRAIQFPAYTIARPTIPKVDFVLQRLTPTLDVIDRNCFLHVAYRLSSSSKWLLATCVDQLGEIQSQKVWSATKGDKYISEANLVAKVWSFTWTFARRARKEWRIVIARWGVIPLQELEAWESFLRLTTPSLPLAVHISVTVAEPNASICVLPAVDINKHPDTHGTTTESVTHFIDASFSTYGVFLAERATLMPQTAMRALDSEIDDILDAQNDQIDDQQAHVLTPLYTAWILHIPVEAAFFSSIDGEGPLSAVSMIHVHLLFNAASKHSLLLQSRRNYMYDLLRSYHQLAVLAREKWDRSKSRGILPWHLAALSLMDSVLRHD